MVDFDRLGSVNGGFDSYEVKSRLETLNNTMAGVADAIDAIKIQFNLDENGFEAAISKASRHRKIRTRS